MTNFIKMYLCLKKNNKGRISVSFWFVTLVQYECFLALFKISSWHITKYVGIFSAYSLVKKKNKFHMKNNLTLFLLFFYCMYNAGKTIGTTVIA